MTDELYGAISFPFSPPLRNAWQGVELSTR
jgi:hypothetical protein